MTSSPGVHLHPADAAELTELLEFLSDWLTSDHGKLDTSLTRFTGSPAYGVTHLHGDLARFAFLLGADGSQLFAGT